MQPLLLGSNVRDDNTVLTVDLTNPDMYLREAAGAAEGHAAHRAHDLSLARHRLSASRACTTTATARSSVDLSLTFGSDFADLFEVRGHAPRAPRHPREAVAAPSEVVLSYEGSTASCGRRAAVRPRADAAHRELGLLSLALAPDEVRGRSSSRSPATAARERADGSSVPQELCCESNRELQRATSAAATVTTSNDLFNEVLCRSMSDLYMLMTRDAAGTLSLCRHSLVLDDVRPRRHHHCDADAVVRSDASRTACCGGSRACRRKTTIRWPTRSPARSCTRCASGEMAALREVPFGLYYGSVDSTPLFVMLAGLYAQRTGDCEIVRELWPAIEAALAWIDGPGDPDGDGFIEYHRANRGGPAPTRAGRIPSTPSSTPTDGWRKGRSRSRKCRATSTPPSAWPRVRAAARQCRSGGRARSAGRETRRAVRGRLLVPGDRHLRARARRQEAAVPRAHLECRAGAVHRHRRRRSARARSARDMLRSVVLLRLGHPHRGARGSRATIRCRTTTARSGRTTTR